MKKKIIGISPRFIDNGTTPYIKVNSDYIKKLEEKDFICIMITSTIGIDNILSLCDGFLITGGDDIDPMYYHENNDLGFSKNINNSADAIDDLIIKHAVKYKKPTLGICRGIQVMAAMLGGSLIQDLNYENVFHPVVSCNMHQVEKVNNHGLAKLLPETFLVNTFHHQAVKTVPDNFIVLYKNGNTIEAMEHKNLPIVGVQWHPERLNTVESSIIFNYFTSYFNK